MVNSAWCLDEFTIEKGGTRLVPASHRVPGSTPSETADDEAVQVATPAGSVIIWCANAQPPSWQGAFRSAGLSSVWRGAGTVRRGTAAA